MGQWEQWRAERLAATLPFFMQSLGKLATNVDDDKQFILQELRLWAESITPSGEA